MRNHMKVPVLVVLFTLVCLIFASVQSDGGNSGPGLDASLDHEAAEVGSTVVLSLNYRLPEGAHLPKDPVISGVKGLTIVERTARPGKIRIKLLVDRLNSWKPGELGLTYLDRQEQPQYLKADPVTLTVLSNLGDKPEEAQLLPIQEIMPTQQVWLTYLLWGMGGIILLLLVSGFFWRYATKGGRKKPTEAAEPANVKALKEMTELEARGLFERGDVKEFYFILTEIIRRYLSSLRGFPAVHLTTEEIARQIDNEQDRKILLLLQEADLVKFAEAGATPARKEGDLSAAVSYVRATSMISKNRHATRLSAEVSP